PKRAEDAPTADPARYPGVNGHGAYSEGIFVGYRWYDAQNIAPLFPFGHGLTYTTFEYSNLHVSPTSDGSDDVRVTVRNTGTPAPPARGPAPPASGSTWARRHRRQCRWRRRHSPASRASHSTPAARRT